MNVRIENAGFLIHFGLENPPKLIMPSVPEAHPRFAIGDRVTAIHHPEWGIGTVRYIYNSFVMVEFQTKIVKMNVNDVCKANGGKLYIKFDIPWLDMLPGIPYETWMPVLWGFKLTEES